MTLHYAVAWIRNGTKMFAKLLACCDDEDGDEAIILERTIWRCMSLWSYSRLKVHRETAGLRYQYSLVLHHSHALSSINIQSCKIQSFIQGSTKTALYRRPA